MGSHCLTWPASWKLFLGNYFQLLLYTLWEKIPRARPQWPQWPQWWVRPCQQQNDDYFYCVIFKTVYTYISTFWSSSVITMQPDVDVMCTLLKHFGTRFDRKHNSLFQPLSAAQHPQPPSQLMFFTAEAELPHWRSLHLSPPPARLTIFSLSLLSVIGGRWPCSTPYLVSD